jgi:KAP family P-loop domain
MYKDLKQAIFRSLAILGKDALRGLAMRFFTEKGIQQVEDNISYKLARAVEFDKQVIYFEGLKKIEEEMQQIMDKYPGSKKRIVVFIDDLDRCSPEHAVEVFESIKVFLDIKGFVFVLGLSRQALDKLIVSKFAKLGVTDMTAEQYIRKIIQIEIQIPKWDESSLDKLIDRFFQKIDGESHNKGEIQKLMKQAAVERNPREAKRFMNKYIMVCKIYSETEIPPRRGQNNGSKFDPKKYLLLEVFRRNWPITYGYYKDGTIEFDEEKVKEWDKVKKWIEIPTEDKRADYQSDIIIKLNTNMYTRLDPYEKIAIDMGTEFRDEKLMIFIRDYKKELKGLRDYIDSYDHISDLSNIRIDTPSPAEDTDLLSKRRSAYTELWPRFKLLFTSVEDRTLLDLKGRSSVNTYQTAKSLLERLQNWYYDYGGGLFMSARTLESYQALNSEVLRALSKHDDSQPNSQDDKLPELEREAIRDRAKALQGNMLKDMGV